MKNTYEFVEAGTEIDLKDEFGNIISIVVTERTVIIYANGYHIKDWKIVIDAIDFHKVDRATNCRWYVMVDDKMIYAKCCNQKSGKREYLMMHRVITDCPLDLFVDHHPNHYGLDNRRCNLTNVTPSENSKNRMTINEKALIYKK